MSRKIFCHQVASTKQLADILEKKSGNRNVIFSDLYYGSFRPHHVATEFAWQLNIDITTLLPLLPDNPVIPHPKGLLNFSSFVSRGIDEESVGDRGVFVASKLAKYILGEATDTSLLFAILLPPPAIFFSSDNQHFILKLIKEVPYSQHDFLLFYNTYIDFVEKINGAEPEDHGSPIAPSSLYQPAPSCYALIQGIIRQDYIEKIGNMDSSLVPINGKSYLVPFENRPCHLKKCKILYDKLSRFLKDEPSIFANANLNGSAYFLKRDFLTGYAWKLVSYGCVDIAIKILNRLIPSAASNTEKSILITQIQGLRISVWAFEDVAGEEIIFSNVPGDLLQFQLLSKGWGAVMVNNLDLAGSCFNEIKDLIDAGAIDDVEYCYFQNIYALYDFKKGDAAEALKKEKKIEAYLESTVNKDFRLYFVNAINQARIFRYYKDYVAALQYYQRAFSTIAGIQRPGDLIYTNFLYAKIFQDLHDIKNTLLHYVRTSLYTLCMEDDELINKRLKANVRYSEKNGTAFIDFFKKILSAKITELCNETIPGFRELRSKFPSLIFKNRSTMSEGEKPVLITDLKYTFSYKPIPPTEKNTRDVSVEHQSLNEVVSVFLFTLFPEIFNTHSSYTIYIDDDNGYDMPVNEEDFTNYTAFQKYSSIILKHSENLFQSIPAAISTESFENVTGKGIRLHSSISKINMNKDGKSYLISYKRYLPDKIIEDTNVISVVDSLIRKDKKQETCNTKPLNDFVNYQKEIKYLFDNKIIEFSKLSL